MQKKKRERGGGKNYIEYTRFKKIKKYVKEIKECEWEIRQEVESI